MQYWIKSTIHHRCNYGSKVRFLTFWKRARLFGLPQLIPQFNVFGYGVVSLPGGIANKPNAWKPPKAVKIDNMIRKLQHRFARKPVNGGVNINRIWNKDKRRIIIYKLQTSNNFLIKLLLIMIIDNLLV